MRRLLTALVLLLCSLPAWAADGDLKFKSNSTFQYVLTDGATSTTTGLWIDVQAFHEATIVVTGITTATVEFDGSNSVTNPGAASNGDYAIGTATATGVAFIGSGTAATNFQLLPRWIKARVSAYTSGTITVMAVFRRAPSL